MKIRVKPASVGGDPLLIPKAPLVVLRLSPGESFPRGAIAADGELLNDSAYLRRLLKSGEVLICGEPGVPELETPAVEDED